MAMEWAAKVVPTTLSNASGALPDSKSFRRYFLGGV